MQAYIDLEHNIDGFDGLPIFFKGCDFNCPYCYSKDMLKFDEEFLIDIKDVKRYIEDNSSSFKSVIFTGGEPCLQRQAMLSLARFCKKKGLRVVLDTNGSKPDSIKSLLMSELVDEVRLDIKSGFVPERFEKVTKSKTFFVSSGQIIDDVKDSLKLLFEYKKVQVTIVTVVIPSVMFRKEDFDDIGTFLSDKNFLWQIKGFEPSESHVDDKFCDISAPTKKFLESIKENLLIKYKNLNIEVL